MKGLSTDLDQLWAEAVEREREGGSIVLSEHLWDEATRVQGFRMIEDNFAEVLTDNFAERTGKVSMDSIKLLLNLDALRMSAINSRRIKAAMMALGWEHRTFRLHDLSGGDKRPRKGFARGTDAERDQEVFAVQRLGSGVVLDIRNAPTQTPF